MDSLKDVYTDRLQDLCSANTQAVAVIRELAEATVSDTFRNALELGVVGIKDGCGKLETLLRAHDRNMRCTFCKGMEGLVREA